MFLRQRVYKDVLEDAQKREVFLCRAVKKRFPYLGISYYPELWGRREHASDTCLVPFVNHKERIKYLKDALKLISK